MVPVGAILARGYNLTPRAVDNDLCYILIVWLEELMNDDGSLHESRKQEHSRGNKKLPISANPPSACEATFTNGKRTRCVFFGPRAWAPSHISTYYNVVFSL